MRALTSLAWRSLWARRARCVLTIGGIGLGVGVLFAALATNDGIDRSIDRTVRHIVGRADLRVAAFTERGLSAATLAAVSGAPGVAVAAPQIERRTFLAPSLQLGAAIPPPVTVLGIDPELDPLLHDLPGSETLRGSGPGALISERLATADGIRIGDRIALNGPADPGTFGIVVGGVLAGDGPLLGTFGRTVVVSLDEARTIFGGSAGISRIDVGLAPGATVDGVSAELESRLTAEPYVLSDPADLAASLRASTADFQSTSSLLAAVALFVGAFLIFNTLSMTVAERFREVGLLRAAGATRRQIAGLVLLQALCLGIAGSVLGLVVGLGLAAVMVGYVQRIVVVPLDGLSVPASGIGLAAAFGMAVTLAAALEPADRAGRISPIEALRSRPDQAAAAGTRARLGWLVIVFAVVAIAGIALWPREQGASAPVRALAVYAILLLTTVLSPFLLPALGRLAGIPFGLIVRTEERLARGAAIRDRGRAALTVGALMVGVAMIVSVGVVALNARQAASSWLVDVVPGDEVVTSIVPAPIDESGPIPDLAAVAGVARVSPIATFGVAYQGVRLDAAAVVGHDLLADGRVGFVAGDRTAGLNGLDDGGTVLLPRSVADRLGLRLGDTMRFALGGGATADLRVAGVVARGLPGRSAETLFVGWSDAIGRFGVLGADSFAVRFDPGRAVTARPGLEQAARQLALEPASLDAIGGAISDALSQVFGLFDALAAVSVLVAGLGIVNALTMSVLERVREIGVLRAAGMTRRQVWRMVVVEAGILGIVGALLGTLAGLAGGFVLVALAGGSSAAGFVGTGSLAVPWATIGLGAVFAIAIAMLAAYYPARVASGLSIVRAVQFE
jgi:putative ABC transport system permease protein